MKVGSLFVLAGYGITLNVNCLTGNEAVFDDIRKNNNSIERMDYCAKERIT